MKLIFRLFVFSTAFFFISCDKTSKVEKEVEQIKVKPIQVTRFEKAFFETKPADLPKLKQEYPDFFPPNVSDAEYIEKMTNPQWRELYAEVEKKYSDFTPEAHEIEDVVRHIKFYYPKARTPKVITMIYEMDYNTKVLYTDSIVLVSLEMYLGKDHRFYDGIDKYIRQNFERRQMMPDLVSSFAATKVPPPAEKTLLANMIYYGKQSYMQDLLIPDYTDAEKIGYTEEQLKWSEANEAMIWSYFIEQSYLYSTDNKLLSRFINLAPFSKFYLEIDNQSPGRIGRWIGWQIVRSFMKNNPDVTLQKMLLMDATEIFNKSKYKPAQHE
ncbi:MAG: gliding motility lipoprotein GldB [Flavobacterium sp. BFFFF1]|uniref:gliding motility lipoprotein GldB n=1 Tax=Flavobacterium sp. BFFFF1 TaxID=2015557 RepID=UPI000BC9A50A|nr:gliding motility lipoprotein GldB [Flavobacterium sp. BFFFF1]OYU80499.1 MAG: gliding motility lipoprotein GldB [Flavobacterium sp. BFFFF1]